MINILVTYKYILCFFFIELPIHYSLFYISSEYSNGSKITYIYIYILTQYTCIDVQNLKSHACEIGIKTFTIYNNSEMRGQSFK